MPNFSRCRRKGTDNGTPLPRRETDAAAPHTSQHHGREQVMKRTGSAQWTGDLKSGKGTVSTSTGVLKDSPYSFSTRFENAPGTNPEELIAAAHAACYSMALSGALAKAGFTPQKVSTTAAATLEQVEGNWTITTIHLTLTANVPGVPKNKFAEIAAEAKANCPVSRVLKANITLEATLQ